VLSLQRCLYLNDSTDIFKEYVEPIEQGVQPFHLIRSAFDISYLNLDGANSLKELNR
jgi:hypothetical protein